jgi:hypothetical protein
MNTLYRKQFTTRIRYALEASRAVAELEHQGLKGAIREVLIADLFQPLLPADIGVATGVLVSSFDERQSAQQDIIVFDRRILPPILFEQGPAIIPIESVLAVIEVKSRLTATELQKAHANVASVRDLFMVQNENQAEVTSAPMTLLFALDTDLVVGGITERDRYVSYFGDGPPTIRGICVAGRCFWVPQTPVKIDKITGDHTTLDGAEFHDDWWEVKADDSHAEVLEVLIGLHRVIERISKSRGSRPLSGYLRNQ